MHESMQRDEAAVCHPVAEQGNNTFSLMGEETEDNLNKPAVWTSVRREAVKTEQLLNLWARSRWTYKAVDVQQMFTHWKLLLCCCTTHLEEFNMREGQNNVAVSDIKMQCDKNYQQLDCEMWELITGQKKPRPGKCEKNWSMTLWVCGP